MQTNAYAVWVRVRRTALQNSKRNGCARSGNSKVRTKRKEIRQGDWAEGSRLACQRKGAGDWRKLVPAWPCGVPRSSEWFGRCCIQASGWHWHCQTDESLLVEAQVDAWPRKLPDRVGASSVIRQEKWPKFEWRDGGPPGHASFVQTQRSYGAATERIVRL